MMQPAMAPPQNTENKDFRKKLEKAIEESRSPVRPSYGLWTIAVTFFNNLILGKTPSAGSALSVKEKK
jgi:hypothetical protein